MENDVVTPRPSKGLTYLGIFLFKSVKPGIYRKRQEARNAVGFRSHFEIEMASVVTSHGVINRSDKNGEQTNKKRSHRIIAEHAMQEIRYSLSHVGWGYTSCPSWTKLFA